MDESLTNHIRNSKKYLEHIERMIANLDSKQSASRVVAKLFSSDVKDAISELEKASTAAFKHHIHCALAPDMFNPFNLYDIERSYSRFSLDEPARTVHLVSRFEDPNPSEKPIPVEDRIGKRIVVYSIISESKTESFVLFHADALLTYQGDETSLQKNPHLTGYLIANHAVRHRLLAATAPPGEVDLESVAIVVKDALGEGLMKPEVATKSWYCLRKEYILDIVSVFALVDARRRMLEVPGIGDVRDKDIEDPLDRYLAMEGQNKKD